MKLLSSEEAGVRVTLREELGERISVVEPAEGTPSAQVLCIHGLSDHLGRQLRFSRWLARQGYRAVSFELIGHGGRASAWSRSAWVYDVYLETDDPATAGARIKAGRQRRLGASRGVAMRQLEALREVRASDHLTQIDRLLEFTRRLDPTLPIVLAGHSLGALLSIETAWRWRPRPGVLAGALLLSPALKPQGRPGNVLERLLVDAVWGLRRAPFSLTRTAVKSALDLNLPVDTSWGIPWISDLPEEEALFSSDPLIPERLPTRYASSIEGQMLMTERRGFAFPLPGLLLVPETDGITSVSAGLSFARAARAAVGPDRFQFEQFKGLRAHDLLRSSARDAVLDRIGPWLAELVRTHGTWREDATTLPLTA